MSSDFNWGKSVTFWNCPNNWEFEFFGSKMTLDDTRWRFFSKVSPLKNTIIFKNLNLLTQRWRFWWKYLPLGLHMWYSRKVNKKIFKLIILLEGKREHIIYNNQPNWSSTDQALATLIHWGKFFGVTKNMFLLVAV